jgi:hypothetical protein
LRVIIQDLSEGSGDISAAAITGNSKIGEFSFRIRESKQFIGRNLQNNNRFPQNVIHLQLRRTEFHYAGLIIGGAWWDLQKRIGRRSISLSFIAARNLPDVENSVDDANSF